LLHFLQLEKSLSGMSAADWLEVFSRHQVSSWAGISLSNQEVLQTASAVLMTAGRSSQVVGCLINSYQCTHLKMVPLKLWLLPLARTFRSTNNVVHSPTDHVTVVMSVVFPI
jgi:hypothetical protein